MNRALHVLTVVLLLGAFFFAWLVPTVDVAAQAPPEKPPAQEPSAEPPAKEPVEVPVEIPSGPGSSEQEASDSEANKYCQSTVEGDVRYADGQPATGATVILDGEGVNRRIMTDDQGHYGFGGLCAGTITLAAFLPDGQTGPSGTAVMDGRSPFHLDLSIGSPAASPTAQPTATTSPQAVQQVATSEPSMPTTGSSSLLAVGAAALATLLLVVVGVGRSLAYHCRARDQE
jgi:hypothetical protein